MALRQRLVEHSGVTTLISTMWRTAFLGSGPRLPAWLRCRPSSICSSMSASLASRVRCSDPRPCICITTICMQATPRRDGIATTSTAPSVKVKTGTSRPRRTDVHASRCTSKPTQNLGSNLVDPRLASSRVSPGSLGAPSTSVLDRSSDGDGARLAFARARWIATEPGDVVIFDHRVLHCGGRTRGPKYSIYLGAGIQNDHFNRHWSYYRDLRSDLHYPSVPEALRERLQSEGLWPEARFLSSSTSSTPSFRRRHDGGFLTSSPTTLKGVEAKARA